MLRRSPRALLLWTAAIAIALVTALVVGTDLAALHRRARDLGPEVAVAVAARDLPVGSTIDEADVRVHHVHRSQLPAGAVDPDAAAGRVVAVPVVRDAFVSRRNLAPRHRDGLDGAVPPGMRVVRVTADAPAASRRTGAAVDVLATFDVGVTFDPTDEESGDPTVAVARGALVLDVDVASGGPGDLAGTAATGDGMTLLVTEAEARALAYAAATAVVTVALVPPEDARAARPT